MKRIVYVSTLMLLAIALVACSTPAAAGAAAAPAAAAPAAAAPAAACAPVTPPLTLCVVHNGADHPSITSLVKGLDEEAKIFNAKVTYFDPALDPQKQATMIEDCIARKPDVLVVNVVDPVAVITSIKKAYDAGIPVITHNANVAPAGYQYIKTFIGADSYSQGYAIGKQMVEKLGNKAANVVFIGGNPGQTDYINRVKGAKDAWAALGVTTYKVIADQPANWNKDKALAVMQDILTRFPSPGIDAVFAMDDPMAVGALNAIKAAGRLKEIAVWGVGGMIDACQAIKAGEMYGTALQLSDLIGVYTVRAAYDIKVGRTVPETILSPTASINQTNIDQWISRCW